MPLAGVLTFERKSNETHLNARSNETLEPGRGASRRHSRASAANPPTERRDAKLVSRNAQDYRKKGPRRSGAKVEDRSLGRMGLPAFIHVAGALRTTRTSPARPRLEPRAAGLVSVSAFRRKGAEKAAETGLGWSIHHGGLRWQTHRRAARMRGGHALLT
jgi:hypothetical protein